MQSAARSCLCGLRPFQTLALVRGRPGTQASRYAGISPAEVFAKRGPFDPCYECDTMTSTLLNPSSSLLETDPLTEPVLTRIAAGDLTAVDECVNRYGGLVWSLARRWFKNSADAEDLTQEIFVDVWQSAKRFDPEVASEVVFITMIARRRMIDRLRRSSVKLDQVSVEASAIEVEAMPAHDRVELADEAAKAARCFEKLSKEQQKILQMSVHQGASHSLIVQALGMPLGTVKSFARRGLLQLRDCMQRGTQVQLTETAS
jgi:RNA polymerase sigma factor (sigma-70 family)